MQNSNDDFIDLTDSFTFVDHCALANMIIDLDADDSINEINDSLEDSQPNRPETITWRRSPRTASLEIKNKGAKENIKLKNNDWRSLNKEADNKFGCCPICWDALGKNSLASTKCGHVYCLKCLVRCLEVEKKCPTCRKVLKGPNAYHPLYLPV